mmetsp:Transcript_8209/g.13222  ORF Transcript_8209/g.13222 Transcript_8209/m.13222 type:complete len:103 (+) Transcript_8209:2234-2542(+)
MAYQGPDGTGKLGDMKPEIHMISDYSDCQNPLCIVGQSDRSQLLHSQSCERQLSKTLVLPNLSIKHPDLKKFNDIAWIQFPQHPQWESGLGQVVAILQGGPH